MRRKRRNRATWLPIIPTDYETPQGQDITWYSSTLTMAKNVLPGDTSIIAIPLTYDDSSTQLESAGASLRDKVEGQDYMLERVVGKVWMDGSYIQPNSNMELYEYIGCVALAVLPTDDQGRPALDPSEYNPFFARNSQQPWLWRRTWRLDTPQVNQSSSPSAITGQGYPTTTAGYSGFDEGGHLDTKGLRRRIRKEHRVFVIFAAGAITTIDGGAEAVDSLVGYGYDLRLLGSMRRARNTSSF